MKKKSWIIGLAVGIVCVLVIAIFLFAGNGKKVDKKEPMKSTQDESVQEEEKDLPIISNDGEEIIIDAEEEEVKTDSEEKEDGKSSVDTTESKENQEEGSGDTSQQEPEQDTGQEEGQEPEVGSKDNPIELPFVPYEKN